MHYSWLSLLLFSLVACSSPPVEPIVDAGEIMSDTGVDQCEGFDFTDMPALAEMMGVYDEQRQRIVFFGGDDVLPVNCSAAPHAVGRYELYTYDTACAAFREETGSDDGPQGRARGMAVYDPTGDRMLIFGGRSRARETGNYKNYNDVWALDFATMQWTELEPTNSGPLARSNPAGGFNRATRELIVFGGNTSRSGLQFGPRNDVWAFDTVNQSWRRIESTGNAPEGRLFHAGVVDDTNNRLFIYGGGDAGAWQGPFLGDLWMMDLETGVWERLAEKTDDGPMGRIWSTITYDVSSDRLVLFGGHDDGLVGNNNDTWIFDLANRQWNAVIEAEVVNEPAFGFCDFPPDFTEPNRDAPDRRHAHLAALDKQRGEWFIFAGKTDCGIINDIWVYDLGRDAWLKRQPSTLGEACVRGDNPDRCVSLCQ